MKTITYKFCDGTTQTVEVSDELYSIHEELEKAERCNNKRETRRHISLDYLNSKGIDFEGDCGDPLFALIKAEDDEQFEAALSEISEKQRQLVEWFFYENRSLRDIAKELGVSHQALSKQMAVILKKLKNLLQ